MGNSDKGMDEMIMRLIAKELHPSRTARPKPTKATHDKWTDCTGTEYWVHRWSLECRNGCAIHAPSYHTTRDWPQLMRETFLIERMCPHGIGHPDPDSVDFFERTGRDGWGVHGCDGCCMDFSTGKHRKPKE